MICAGRNKDLPLSQPPKKFRANKKMFLITFPKCETLKESVKAHLDLHKPFNTVQPIQYYEIAQEKHQDGSSHLHVFIIFQRDVNVKDPKFFDRMATDGINLKEHHGNILPVDSVQGTVDYIRKFDKHTLKYGTLPVKLLSNNNNKRSSTAKDDRPSKISKSSTIAEAIQSGVSLEDAHQMDAGYFLVNQKKITEYMAYVQSTKMRDHLKYSIGIEYSGDDPVTDAVVKWLDRNLYEKRAHKQAQLYLWGPPNSGKTSLITEIVAPYFSVYEMPHDRYCTGYNDSQYDIVMWDEFQGPRTEGKQQSFINEFLEGKRMPLPNRYHGLMKLKNIPVVILSNYSLSTLYKTKEAYAQMRARVLEIEIKEDTKLDWENISVNPNLL